MMATNFDPVVMHYIIIMQNNGRIRYYLAGSLGDVAEIALIRPRGGRLVFRDGSSIKFRKMWLNAFNI